MKLNEWIFFRIIILNENAQHRIIMERAVKKRETHL